MTKDLTTNLSPEDVFHIRTHAGFRSKKAFAEALGVAISTYLKMESLGVKAPSLAFFALHCFARSERGELGGLHSG
jgi:hypothetical protein